MELWNNNIEIHFFREALKNFSSPEQLFYKLKDGYYAYIPKREDSEGQTLQSRNALIGKFTENWCRKLFEPIGEKFSLYTLNNVICYELGLTKQSSADLVFSTKNKNILLPNEIKMIFEIKMSIVSNYKFYQPDKLEFIGDYNQHKGNPSLLRSDSMLKAMGKALNIKASSIASSKIPIIVIGNSPISNSYVEKVDRLKSIGVIQGFWSLNPQPSNSNFIKETPNNGFITIDSFQKVFNLCSELLNSNLNYFSSMISTNKLGEYISIASKEQTNELKAEKFLKLLYT